MLFLRMEVGGVEASLLMLLSKSISFLLSLRISSGSSPFCSRSLLRWN